MPHTLGHLNEKDRIKVAESLTHYLVSLDNKKKFELQVPDSVAEHGEALFHQVGCAMPLTERQ